MRIVLGQYADKTKIFTDDGVDITDQLRCTGIYINAMAGQLTEVTLTCYATEIIAESGEVNLDVKDWPPPPPPPVTETKTGYVGPQHLDQPPEAVLGSFKITKPETE